MLNLLVLMLFFVNLAHSEKIYEINFNKNLKLIKNENTNGKLRVNAKLDGDWHKAKCNALCEKNGVEYPFDLYCAVKSVVVGDFYVNVETDIDNSTSLLSEWHCNFNVTRYENKRTSFGVNFVIDSREQPIMDTEDNSCWKPIAIVAILISIFQATFLVFIWLKSKGFNISLKLYFTKDVLDSSKTPLTPPPPPLLPKMKKQEAALSPSSQRKTIKIEPLREIPIEDIKEAPMVAEGYEVMTPRMPEKKIRIPSFISESSDKMYHEIIAPQHIYDNDIILFKPFEKLHNKFVKFEDSKTENCTNQLKNDHCEIVKSDTLATQPRPQIASKVAALQRQTSVTNKIKPEPNSLPSRPRPQIAPKDTALQRKTSVTNNSSLPILTPYNIRELVESKVVLISEPVETVLIPTTPKKLTRDRPMISGPINLQSTTALNNDSESSDDEWTYDNLDTEECTYKNVP